MPKRSPVAFVVVILLLAVMGFAAFSSEPVETSATSNGVVLPPVASGRIAAAAVASQLRTSPVPQTQAPRPASVSLVAEPTTTRTAPLPSPEQARIGESRLATTTTTEAPLTAPPTTADPTTTAAPTTAPPTTTTPPTTAPPTTTPPTTTTTPPTTTTTPPTTTPPDTTTTTEAPAPPPASVEQWRSLVEAYWPAELVDDALNVMACESGGDPNALNPASGAAGLFQFIPGTWESASASAGWEGADVFDPEANIAVAYWLYASTSPPWQQWSCKP